MDGRLYRVEPKPPWYYYRKAVHSGELLVRIATFSGLFHNNVIFLKENGSFFDVRLSKSSDFENLAWLGIRPV